MQRCLETLILKVVERIERARAPASREGFVVQGQDEKKGKQTTPGKEIKMREEQKLETLKSIKAAAAALEEKRLIGFGQVQPEPPAADSMPVRPSHPIQLEPLSCLAILSCLPPVAAARFAATLCLLILGTAPCGTIAEKATKVPAKGEARRRCNLGSKAGRFCPVWACRTCKDCVIPEEKEEWIARWSQAVDDRQLPWW